MSAPGYDVAVVGASTAGCTAARLFAQAGARVALIERRSAIDAYKTVCTHFIQSSATPTIERLGLAALIEEHGGVRNSIDVWTPFGGWIRASDDLPYGYSITRRKLDPMLRELTARTDGVDLLAGETVVALTGDGRPDGVEIEGRSRTRRTLKARLVVAADGRGSRLARLAGVRGRVLPHNRFFYWAYWRGLEPATTTARMWLAEPDCAYTFPNENGLTLALVAPHKRRLPEFRDDLEGAYRRFLAALPDAPDFAAATRESKLLGKLDLPNVARPAARPGIAFVGDAAQASDPLWGVGCGWAFQSAEWLVDATAEALREPAHRLDAALDRYRRIHRRRLMPHHLMVSDYSTGRPANPIERALFRAAAVDTGVERRFAAIGSRRHSPARMLNPRVLGGVAAAAVRSRGEHVAA
jgi:flavin-dependent dehydrogenase